MKENSAQIAVIYCRVSTVKQTTQGNGLGSQETRCREYAKYKGYTVAQVFQDDISGSLIGRPGMQAMLAFLRKHRAAQPVVIIDDISRLARGLDAHLRLRAEIGNAGGRLASPTIEFGEDSDSQLVENLLASVSQHQRQKNGEQTRNRMRARAMQGFWMFPAPIGYRFERVAGRGRMIVPAEPQASIIREALEGFAAGRFETQGEVKRFLESRPLYKAGGKTGLTFQRITDILTQPLYAGYFEVPCWNLPLRQGKHEPLISYETFQAVQSRLAAPAKAPVREDIGTDFPLRGFVVCDACRQPLTANWSKGRAARYPYYLCFNKGCAEARKSIRREVMEGEFEALLKSMRPSRELFDLVGEMFRDLWDTRLASVDADARTMKAELADIDRKVSQLFDRIVDASSDTLINAYEARIRTLEERKVDIAEKVKACGRPLQSFDAAFRTAFDFLANPWNLWASERVEDKRIVLRLAFADRLPYRRGEGFRTANLALPFKVLDGLKHGENAMASPTGFEPVLPT